MAGLLQLRINATMEPKPADGNVFIQRIGNSSERFTDQDGLHELLPGRKVEWPAGNHTITNSNGQTHDLMLEAHKCGYVLSMFTRANSKGYAIS